MKPSFFLLLLLAGNLASAATTAELLDQLKTELKAQAKTSGTPDNPVAQQRAYQLQEMIAQVGPAGADEYSGANALRAIEGIEALATSDKITELCRTLARQMRAEQEAKENAVIAGMQKGFAAALQAGLAAATPKDLDAPMASVTQLLQHSRLEYSNNPKLSALANQGQQLSQFLQQWQDCLAGIDTGDGNSGRLRLQNLLNSSRDFSSFIPRSELLAKLAEFQKARNLKEGAKETALLTAEEVDEKARAMVAATHTLKEVNETIHQLEVLSAQKRGTPFGSYLSNSIQSLRSLERIYLDLEQGLATNIHLSTITSSTSSENDETVASLRAQLLLYALPRVLGVGDADAPHAGENAATYLNRIAAEAREKSNWTLLSRTVDIAQTLNVGTTSSTSDRTALQSFLAGVNQERARQYALAVSSFQAALKAGSQIISPEMIGDHLEAIRKDHPQEYEQGMQIALNPPLALDPRYADPRSRIPYYPGSPFPQTGVPQPPPSITVPAAPAKNSATPPPPAGAEVPKSK